MSGRVVVAHTGGVALVTIDDPPLNALNTELVEQIGQAFDAVARSDSRAVVLTGAGEKAFAAGADISQFPGLDDRSGMELVRHGQRVYQKIADFDRPVLCAVNGYALGGGCELALACDIRVAAENAKFGLPEVTLGILPGYGGTQRLPRLVGVGMAKKLILTGEPITAQEAHRIGLVECLTPPGGAVDGAMALARRILTACGPVAVRYAKAAIDGGADLPLPAALDLEAKTFGRLCLTQDKNEGVAAFFEKRKPEFRGM